MSTVAQRALLAALNRYFSKGLTFTRDQLLQETGWTEVSLSTYESKMIGFLFEEVGDTGKLRISEAFRRYSNWDDFKRLVSQKKTPMLIDYDEQDPQGVLVFEFFLPLAQEVHLRYALDSLFYKDKIISRLKLQAVQEHKAIWGGTKDGEEYLEELASWLGSKFFGYSMSHVQGRYRALDFKDREGVVEAETRGEKYLVDETTAIVRFILPLAEADNPEIISHFFRIVFVKTVLEVVDKEAEIWLLESGAVNRLLIWRRKEKNAGERKKLAGAKSMARSTGANLENRSEMEGEGNEDQEELA